jgi:hypothetical protein
MNLVFSQVEGDLMSDPNVTPSHEPAGSQPAANPYASAPAAPAAPYSGTPGPAQPKTLSIISMIAGIVGVLSFGYFGIASIAAVILGFMGKKREPAAKGFWLTGIITGFVGIGIMIITIIFWIVVLIAAGSAASNPSLYDY